ncbi:MAG: hypothetical protein WC523_06360 [Patescibacteria group bacterium]
MFSSLATKKKSVRKASKILAIFLLAFMIFSFLAIPARPVQAQALVFDAIGQAWKTSDTIWQKLTNTLKILWDKGGSLAFQQVLRSTLNTIAYDTANYVGSGGEGQKPLFVTQDWGAYLSQVGDEAAGSFIESFANNLSVSGSQNLTNEADTCQSDYKKCTADCLQAKPGDTGCTNACSQTFSACSASLAKRMEQYSNGNFGSSSGSDTLSGQISPSFNVCEPSSLESKVKITLGLVDQSRPSTPNCKATEIVKNWVDVKNVFKLTGNDTNNFLNNFTDIFDPRGNDLGIYWIAKTDLSSKQAEEIGVADTKLIGQKGWLDRTSISGNRTSLPNQAELDTQQKSEAYSANFGKYTGDAFVDALNVFLNQLALSAFNNLMHNIGKQATEGGSNQSNLTNSETTLTFGESSLKEATSKLTKPDFGVRTDYNILANLSMCPNSENPGPTNCVIDNKLMQGITEKKTVAEALKEGYLYGNWQLTVDNQSNSYSLRNVSILRKYRILPVGWEVAIKKANENPNQIKKITLNDLVSCFDPNDQYSQFSSEFDTRNQGWCQGLVDPNWVLKAPLNYCKKQGVSSQILHIMSAPGQKGIVGSPDLLSEIKVTRAEDYCADEQTCIKEKNDGSCEVYGYCNEEKRTWNFGTDSCEAIYNTCQTFTNTSDNKTVSYLKNTLNYGGCDSGAAGCKQYSLFGTYATSTGTVSWDAGRSAYFNKNLVTCNSKDEGCTEFLRVKPTWGANLVMNADFGNDTVGDNTTSGLLNDWPVYATGGSLQALIVDSASEPGGTSGKALRLEADGTANTQIIVGLSSEYNHSLVPGNMQMIPGQAYTLSADVYLVSGDHVYAVIGQDSDGTLATTTVKNSWQHLSVTRRPSDTYNEPIFNIHGDTSGSSSAAKVIFYVKNIKLEMSDWDTGYNSYGGFKIYEKLLPPYLEKSCYVDVTSASKDYQLKDNAPAACYNFARRCNKDEVGCDLYTAVKNNYRIPAKANNIDYCPAQCVGYDVYVSKISAFNSPSSENLMPKTAETCSADAVGCNEFTNLDELAQGGEKKEYYTYLKQCIKPTQGTCDNFYAWEGTENGYQLKTYILEKAINGQPEVTDDDSNLCDAAIYNLPLSDPGYNPDCREFYNSAGAVSYHLISRVFTCSDNCHAYRMSENNIDQSLKTNEACDDAGGQWKSEENVCYLCLNKGVWDTRHNACIYQAIPGEGKICSADQNGCREYNGNAGNNERLAASYDFENGRAGWFSNCNGGVGTSSISYNKNGHSLFFNANAPDCLSIGKENMTVVKRPRLIEELLAANNSAAQLKVNGLVSAGQAYSIHFLARANVNTTVSIYFLNSDTGEMASFSQATSALVIKGGNEWGVYRANLENLDHEVGANELLIITGDNSFYFDDLTLTEITDRYYLIKNSSVIPDICYYDAFDNYQGADYNLGCAAYTDSNNLKHNLRQFSRICSDSAVGCEQMINTKNYAPYGSGIWQDTNQNKLCEADEPDCVAVSGDSALYAVYDPNKQCNSADLGCSRLGQGQNSGASLVWSDVFKENNPNIYDKILCGQDALGCEEWRSAESNEFNYFKNPGSASCSYRDSQNPTISGKGWYKIPVKRCDTDSNGKIEGAEKNTKICSSAANCNNKPCITDNNDYPCSVSYFKTFGLGGAGNQVPVPDQEAGLCDVKNSTCTEYIDPVSRFSANLVYNPSYQLIDNNHEGWTTDNKQSLKIEPNKLYIFNIESESGNNPGLVQLDFPAGVKPLLNNNTLGTTTKTLQIPAGTNRQIFFASLNNSSATVAGGQTNKTIVVKEAIIDYQLQANVDKKSCNGLAKFDNGCILFNERSINGGQGLIDLSNSWNAYATSDGQAPANCNSSLLGSCNANQLVKVRPNRVCAKWLDCLTYVKDPVTNQRTCYALGECNRLNDKNECASFIDTLSTSTPDFSPERDKNATGYSLVDKYYFSQMTEVGLNSEAHYDFEDSVPTLSCSRAVGSSKCSFTKNIAADSIIREPDNAPTDYPAHGKSYLKVSADYIISPQAEKSPISLIKNSEYYINYLINTRTGGLATVVEIKASSSTEFDNPVSLGKFTVAANNGWQRVVQKFNTGSTPYVQIYLGADNPKKIRGYVYFDDINIEPVLKVNDNQYVAKECRLYPDNESLTCLSKNNNVVSDGLEGYCLEHDPENPEVCLLWYPVDSVSSARNSLSSLGYTGKFPLNYCTELNGNFDLVEKRSVYLVESWHVDVKCEKVGGNYSCANCLRVPLQQSPCPNDYVKIRYQYSPCGQSNDECYYEDFCVPREKSLKIRAQVKNQSGNNCNWSEATPLTTDQYDDKHQIIVASSDEWANGSSLSGCSCGNETRIMSVEGEGWYVYNGMTEEEKKNADPPVRVYDYSRPASGEEDLKLIADSDADKVFRLTCNRFTQVVGNNGENKAWTNRISSNSIYATQTPPFFVDDGNNWYGAATTSNISRYGRNREEAPYGAAVWPDNFDLLNSEPVKFRNQYSKKNNETVFAGRPFGCFNDSGIKGCQSIGYCSLDPNVFCLLGQATSSDYVSQKTCAAGGFGTCYPIWSPSDNYLKSDKAYKNILRTLFVKSYGAFRYEFDSQTYAPTVSPDGIPDGIYDDYATPILPFKDPCDPGPDRGTKNDLDSFCAVRPKIENLTLKFINDQSVPSNTPLVFEIPARGVYKLEFNTTVDPEQQPLKEIRIDWGGGDPIQIITGQDHHPSTSTPHVFYHYYRTDGPKNLRVTIFDNWGKYYFKVPCLGLGVCLPPIE